MSSPKPLTVFIASGTASTGAATIESLLKSHSHVTIRAGARDVARAASKFPGADAKRLSFHAHDVKGGALSAAAESDLKAVDALLLVAPQQFQDRIGVTTAYIKAAKQNGVKHIVFVSAPAARNPALILGKDLHAAEKLLTESGIPTTFLHPVFFFDNYLSSASTIKSQGAWYGPSRGNAPIGNIAVSDIGAAAANVLVGGPAKHAASPAGTHTYTLSGPTLSWDDAANGFSKALGKPVRYVQVPDSETVKALAGFGLPETFAKGLVELHHEFEKSAPIPSAELKALLNGAEPVTFEQWLAPRVGAFKA